MGIRGRGGTRRAQHRREYPARSARRPPLAAPAGNRLSAALRQALDAFDEPAAQAVLDRLLADLSVPAVLRDVVLPYLAELGERWQRGTASVALEHFASNLIRGRLAGLARGWGSGHGPQALLTCPPGELHDMALMVFGIVLHRNGWRIGYLGPDTPVGELARAIDASHPDLVILAATLAEILEPLRPELASLAQRAPLALAGAGATAQIATAAGARLIAGMPARTRGRLRPAREALRRAGSFGSAGEVPREVGQLFEKRGVAVLGSGGSSAYRHGEAGESAARSRPRLTASAERRRHVRPG